MLVVLLMRKTAFALMLTTVFFSIVFFSQTRSLANANPFGSPWHWGDLKINVTSPWGIYSQDNVWLNFTVTKPSNWTELGGHLNYVAYLVDGERYSSTSQNPWDQYKVKVAIQDPVGVANPPLQFNFTLKLNGLSEGQHYVDLFVEAHVQGDTLVGVTKTMDFLVQNESPPHPTPQPTQDIGLKLSPPQQTAVLSGAIAIVSVVLLAYYFKKRQRSERP